MRLRTACSLRGVLRGLGVSKKHKKEKVRGQTSVIECYLVAVARFSDNEKSDSKCGHVSMMRDSA